MTLDTYPSLSPRMRVWCGFLAGFCALVAFAIASDPTPYDAPIFDTIRAMAPSLDAWASGWAACGLAAAVSVLTGNRFVYRVAAMGASAIGFMWWFGLTWAHFVDGHRLSWSGWALWGWFIASNMVVYTAKSQFSGRRE